MKPGNGSPEALGQQAKRGYFPGAGMVTAGGAAPGADVRFGDGCQPVTASITAKPTTYAITTCQPCFNHRPTDFASLYMFEIATPAEDPNQIIEPPKPTA
jgi:hypothetical protein